MATEQQRAMELNKLPVGANLTVYGEDAKRILELALGGPAAFNLDMIADNEGRTRGWVMTKIRATGMEGQPIGGRLPPQDPGPSIMGASGLGLAAAAAQEAERAGWDGEHKARYWQARALMVENALAAILHYLGDEITADEAEDTSLTALRQSGERALAESRKIDSNFDIAAYLREKQQEAVLRWVRRAFGDEVAVSVPERALRMFEEACELYQAVIFAHYRTEADEDHNETRILARVTEAFNQAMTVFRMRWQAEPGDIEKEAGGLMVTLSALAPMAGINLHTAEQAEFVRVLAKPQSHWEARQAEKRGQGLVG